MTRKSKPELRMALARIMEVAKFGRDFSSSELDRQKWAEVAEVCADALDNPTVADIQEILAATQSKGTA